MKPVAAAQPSPAAAKRPKPIRVVRGPDGKQRIVRRGASAFAALQANLQKVIRIGVIQGARIIEERIIRERETVTVGASEKNHLVVPQTALPPRHPLFELRPGPKGGQYLLTFTDEMTGRVGFPPDAGGVQELAALKASGKAVRSAKGWQVPLTDDCRGRIAIGDTTMLFQFVIPPPMQPPPQLPASVRGGWLNRLDPWLIVCLVLSAGAHGGLLGWVLAQDWPEPTLEELLASDYSPVKMVAAEPEPPPPTDQDDTDATDGEGAERDPNKEGEVDPNAEGPAADTPATGPATPGPVATGPTTRVGGENLSARAADRARAGLRNTLDLASLTAGPGGSGPNFGLGAFDGVRGSAAVTGIDTSGMAGVGIGDGTGIYGTGDGNLAGGPSVGVLDGGGGDGDGTGPGGGDIVVPDRPVDVPPPAEIIKGTVRQGSLRPAAGSTGRMDANAFRQRLQAKWRQIEACYNTALNRRPSLSGDLVFVVVVDLQGRVTVEIERDSGDLDSAGVTNCIVGKLRSLNFAASPPVGGEFRARVPMSFSR